MKSLISFFGITGRSTTAIRFTLLYLAVALLFIFYHYRCVRNNNSTRRRHLRRSNMSSKRFKRISFDKTFFRRLIGLLGICFPSPFCMESGILVLLTVLFVIRTTLKLTFARIIGVGGRAVVQRDFKQFVFSVADVVLYSIPAAATTFGVVYTKCIMEQCFRKRVQNVLHKEYFEGNKIYSLAMTSIIDNPSHRLTNDVRCFCSELASFFSAIAQPVIDIVVFSFAFARSGGFGAPFLLTSYYVFVAFILRVLLPNFANLIARSREHEGSLRALHTQLIQHAEEVSFYRGEEVEVENADRLLKLYIRLEQKIKKAKLWAALVNSVLVRDGATCVAYLVCSFIVMRGRGSLNAAQLAQLFISSTQLLVPFSRAVGKLFFLHLKVSALCGSAHRVGELRDALHAADGEEQDNACGTVVELPYSDEISFRNVMLTAPSNQVILRNFTTVFRKGRHVLITGDNGTGKTAILRLLCGLWPLRGGTLSLPPFSHLFFTPQRIYLPPGSLRTQFIYPALEGEVERTRDEELLQLAADVGLSGVVRREGGLDAKKAWSEVLSGGERQRLAIVRALYHKPTFVFLDECTSAVSQDVVLLLYEVLQQRDITLVTISNNEALRFCHQQFLKIDGEGNYTISTCDDV